MVKSSGSNHDIFLTLFDLKCCMYWMLLINTVVAFCFFDEKWYANIVHTKTLYQWRTPMGLPVKPQMCLRRHLIPNYFQNTTLNHLWSSIQSPLTHIMCLKLILQCVRIVLEVLNWCLKKIKSKRSLHKKLTMRLLHELSGKL